MKRPLHLLSLAGILLLSACSPKYYFEVDALSMAPIEAGQSFYLSSANPDLKDNDLRFLEAARFVATALEGKGLKRVNNVRSADMLIEVDFGVGEPREILDVRSYPETYWRPGFAYSIQVPVTNKAGVIVGYQSRVVREPPRSYTYWEDRLESYTIFEKFLTVSAYDNRLGASVKEPQQLWGVSVTNADTSQDIRVYLPYMVAAALPYFAEDTGSQIRVELDLEDPSAQFIRNPDAPIAPLK